jgi:4-diphosphocytidyl-2-C-methyl-D-erythritol kinase
MPTAVRSHAKINLGLGIGAPRADGFHSLVTLYQTLELHDWVTVSARRAAATTIRLSSNERRVPVDGRNTAWKMVALAVQALGISAEIHVHIEKQLPIQGGLGAGSANAVAALIGLEAELGISLSHASHPSHKDNYVARVGHPDSGATWAAERLQLAAKVGSDVPLFLIGGAVLGLDRGQSVFPMPDVFHGSEAPWCVVAIPSVGVSTPQAFRDWDALCIHDGLTSDASEARLSELSRVYASALTGAEAWDGSSGVSSLGRDLAGPQMSALVRTGIANDFERVVFLQHPLLSEIKRTLAAAGTPEEALLASLSGSGSALFGLYRGQGDAEAARERLRGTGVHSLLTRTLPRSAYWRQMLQQ